METTHTRGKDARVVSIHTESSSWGIFCLSPDGDLFLNSDWGMYGYAWRSFGTQTFFHFISTCHPEYIVQKLENNYYLTCGKKIKPHVTPHLITLVQELINYAKTLP